MCSCLGKSLTRVIRYNNSNMEIVSGTDTITLEQVEKNLVSHATRINDESENIDDEKLVAHGRVQ